MKILKISILSIFFTLISCSKDEPIPERETPVNAAFVSPTIGGANEQNQVYIDLSSNTQTPIQRDSWDLRFYNGSTFHVSLNTSVFMATKNLEITDLSSVTTATVQDLFPIVATGTFDPNNVEFVDDFDGDIENTAIAAISENDEDNKVYLLNLGYEVGTDTPAAGSTAVAGAHRGWKKIRILQRNDNYLLQYANLDDSDYQEITISKNNTHHFKHFSFNTEAEVNVSPEKQNWDFCFTIFTNEISGYGTYGYADYVLTNNLQNVAAYQVSTTDFDYDNFTLSDIVQTEFATTQRAIGSSWRIGGGPGVSPHTNPDVFYVLQDAEGIYYKIKFLTLTNDAGERGNTQFQYTQIE